MGSPTFARYQSNEAFIADRMEKYAKFSEQTITEKRLKRYETEKKMESREGFDSLVRMLIIVVVNAVVFTLHWRIVKKEKKNTNTARPVP
jgi:hypothetical protein